MNSERTIAIIGGTGKIGSALVNALLKKGFNLKLLARKPEKLSLVSNRIQIIHGDARDPEAIHKLVQNCEVVINTIGQPQGERPLFSKVTSNIIEALEQNHIQRYIVIAGLGLETPSDKKRYSTKLLTRIMRMFAQDIMEDKEKEYQQIILSNLDWTIIRIPKVIFSETTKGISVSETDSPGLTIHSSDLVNLMIEQLFNSSYVKKVPFIANR